MSVYIRANPPTNHSISPLGIHKRYENIVAHISHEIFPWFSPKRGAFSWHFLFRLSVAIFFFFNNLIYKYVERFGIVGPANLPESETKKNQNNTAKNKLMFLNDSNC